MRRLLKNHPGYVSLATGVLAFAVGINLLIFGIVNALWLRPLPVVEADRVVTILQSMSTVTSLESSRLGVFEGPIAGQVVTTGFNEAFRPRISLPHDARPLETLGVTPLYFSILGVPVRGRVFTDADESSGAEGVAIISDRLWARVFRRSDEVIGSVVAATPLSLRIVGIAPPGFEGARRGERAEMWVPTRVLRQLAPRERQLETVSMMVFSRLAPGQSVGVLEQRYRERLTLPEGDTSTSTTLPTFALLTDVYGTSDSPTILIRESGALLVASLLSLVILLGACATIAALVLTHYERRRPEFALKLALGARPTRLCGELLSESMLVAVIGSVSALACGLLGLRAMPALSLPGGVNVGVLDFSLDWRLCAVAFGVTLLTLTVAGSIPLWQSTRHRLAGNLCGLRNVTLGSLRLRRSLLAVQVCATTVVLIASGLFVRTVMYGFRQAHGFAIDRTVFIAVQEKSLFDSPGDLKAVGYARRAQLTAALEQLPFVRSVAGGPAPLGEDALASLRPRTISTAGREERLLVGLLSGTPNILSALGVPLLAGRALEAADEAAAGTTPVLVTRSLAVRLWPNTSALGQVFSVPELRLRGIVVGLSGDFAFGTLARPLSEVIVTGRGDFDFRASNLIVQTDDPPATVAAIRNQLEDRVVRVTTGREAVARDISQQRLGAWVFSGFGTVALLLGIGGVFGLVGYLAQSRQREFAVRMALGATLGAIVRLGVIAALVPVGVGIVSGLVVGAMVSRLFAALLVGIGGLDLVTYAGVCVGLVCSATLAALSGAWRLRRTTPADALRTS